MKYIVLLVILFSSCSYKITNNFYCTAPVNANFSINGVEVHTFNVPYDVYEANKTNGEFFLTSVSGAKLKRFDNKSNRWIVVY